MERTDEYVQNVWLPVFLREIFSDPRMKAAIDLVYAGGDPVDMAILFITVGDKIRGAVNAKIKGSITSEKYMN